MEILIVDDNPLNLLVTEIHISSWGFKVQLAQSGHQALQLIKRKKFDLVFMDIQMPVQDGFETTKQIREINDGHYNKIPIIALTSVNNDQSRQKAFDNGMNDYLLKPFKPDQLRELILKYSEKK